MEQSTTTLTFLWFLGLQCDCCLCREWGSRHRAYHGHHLMSFFSISAFYLLLSDPSVLHAWRFCSLQTSLVQTLCSWQIFLRLSKMCVWLYVILIGQEGSSHCIRQEKEQVLGGSCRDWTHVSAFGKQTSCAESKYVFQRLQGLPLGLSVGGSCEEHTKGRRRLLSVLCSIWHFAHNVLNNKSSHNLPGLPCKYIQHTLTRKSRSA